MFTTVEYTQSAKAFECAFVVLPIGMKLLYHVGYLAIDRGKTVKTSETTEPTLAPRLTEAAETLNSVALRAMRFEQEGRAELIQVKRSRYVYEYWIVKRCEVNEEGRCRWEKFAATSRTLLKDRRRRVDLGQKELGRSHFSQRQAFFLRNPHLSPINQAVHAPCLDDITEAA